MAFANSKGKGGEREFCKWLKENLALTTDRNYNQSQGGADIEINEWLFEVKRQESLSLNNWWYQVITAKAEHPDENMIPVVCFRQNRKPWEFLIPAKFLGLDAGYIRLAENVFIKFAKKLMKGDNMPFLEQD